MKPNPAVQSAVWSCVGIGLFLGTWAIWPGSVAIPSLGAVLAEFPKLISSGQLGQDMLASLLRVLAGVSLAFVTALVLATVAATVPRFRYALLAVTELLRPIPPIAWVPIVIVLFGIGNRPAIAIVTLGAFFPIWLGCLQGIDAIRLEHVRAARSLGASRLQEITMVLLPTMRPYALHGLRLGGGLGWFCVVAAEMMGASSGLGHRVQLLSLNIQMDAVFAYLIVIGAIGAALNFGLRALAVSIDAPGRTYG